MEDRHDVSDALKGDLRVLGLAVSDPPVQAVDLRDDHRPGVLPLRRVDRQGAGCLFGMVRPHGDAEPVEEWGRRDASIDQDQRSPEQPSVNLSITKVRSVGLRHRRN